jgi:zinc transporter ZupT
VPGPLLVPSFMAALGLAVVHMVAGRLRFIDVIPRSRFLSFAGGISVSYVFLRVLPDLGRSQARVGYEVERNLMIPQDPIYLVAMIGLITFYGLERLADASRRQHRRAEGEDTTGVGVLWLSIASYSMVNFAVGYLLVYRAGAGVLRLSLFFLAIALWFVVSDYGLRVQHRDRYRSIARWVLAAAVIVGWGAATAGPIPDSLMSVAMAFVAGGVVMNVLKEELPRERESTFWAFALGACAYAGLLMAI